MIDGLTMTPAFFFCLMLICEALFPFRKRVRPQRHRFLINMTITAFVFFAGSLVVKPLAIGVANLSLMEPTGILGLLPLPNWSRFIVGFLLMDLSFYYWHRLNHAAPLFWRFHLVHHIDPDLDVSTSYRFHIVEILYSSFFRVFQVLIIGVSPMLYFAYELIFLCATMFHHSNLRLPLGAERLLNRLLVTPRMHGIHHSGVRDETNSNYSVIFRWWDWLHGTLKLNVPQSKIMIGVPAHMAPEDNRLIKLLKMPFRKQIDDWVAEEGSHLYTRDSDADSPAKLMAG
jgi:sterol desaturase/sphingolipid hydroxylase (fatty acid hydroxylase superfamily)